MIMMSTISPIFISFGRTPGAQTGYGRRAIPALQPMRVFCGLAIWRVAPALLWGPFHHRRRGPCPCRLPDPYRSPCPYPCPCPYPRGNWGRSFWLQTRKAVIFSCIWSLRALSSFCLAWMALSSGVSAAHKAANSACLTIICLRRAAVSA